MARYSSNDRLDNLLREYERNFGEPPQVLILDPSTLRIYRGAVLHLIEHGATTPETAISSTKISKHYQLTASNFLKGALSPVKPRIVRKSKRRRGDSDKYENHYYIPVEKISDAETFVRIMEMGLDEN